MSLKQELQNGGPETTEQNLKYVAVTQDVDKLILAQMEYDEDSETDYASSILQVLCAPDYRHQTTAGSLYALEKKSIDRTFHMLVQEQESDVRLVYILITVCLYPHHRAGTMLRELRTIVNKEYPRMLECNQNDEKTAEMSPLFSKLFDIYNKVDDKLLRTVQRINAVKMDAHNVNQNIEDSIQNAEARLVEAQEVKKRAITFDENAKAFKRSEYWKRWKRRSLIIVVVILVLGILLGIVIPKFT